MKKFIYVYTPEAKETLLKAKFKLLKSDERLRIFIFENQLQKDNTQKFALDNISHILSDVLTF